MEGDCQDLAAKMKYLQLNWVRTNGLTLIFWSRRQSSLMTKVDVEGQDSSLEMLTQALSLRKVKISSRSICISRLLMRLRTKGFQICWRIARASQSIRNWAHQNMTRRKRCPKEKVWAQSVLHLKKIWNFWWMASIKTCLKHLTT